MGVAAFIFCLNVAASLPRTDPRISPVVQSLSELRVRLAIPGLAAAIVIDGRTVWQGEWGNLTDRKSTRLNSSHG